MRFPSLTFVLTFVSFSYLFQQQILKWWNSIHKKNTEYTNSVAANHDTECPAFHSTDIAVKERAIK
jgi:hypothetical protein